MTEQQQDFPPVRVRHGLGYMLRRFGIRTLRILGGWFLLAIAAALFNSATDRPLGAMHLGQLIGAVLQLILAFIALVSAWVTAFGEGPDS